MLRRVMATAVVIAAVVGGSTFVAGAGTAPGSVYLALGDSLAAGVQASGERHAGYAEQLYQLEQARIPDLRLVNLGCPGSTTRTMTREVSRCRYAEGSQLEQALEVLRRGDVAFVTLHVGSNDVIRCFDFAAVAFDDACVSRVLPAMTARLTAIVEALREADPDVPIVGGNYHDPLLVTWVLRGVPREAVMRIADVWTSFNDALETTYADLGVPVADIESEFSTDDFTTQVRARGHGVVPLNVARVCQWTAACGATFDPHPNTVGYAAMTRAWLAALSTTTG